MEQSTNFLLYVMFWTILAMMLVLIYSLKQVLSTQRYLQRIDVNIEKLVKKTLAEEERILADIENTVNHKFKKTKTKSKK